VVAALAADLQAVTAEIFIYVNNNTNRKIRFEVLRGGNEVLARDLGFNERVLICLKRGYYSLRYGLGRVVAHERVKVERPQEWRIAQISIPRGDDRPPAPGYARSSHDIDVIGDPQLRAQIAEARRLEGVAREVSLATAQNKVAAAIAARSWDRAWEVIEQTRTAYPGAPAVGAMAAQVRSAGSPAVIEVANLSGHAIGLSLLRGEDAVVAKHLPARDRVVLSLELGQYSLRCAGAGPGRTEMVAVDGPQEWRIAEVDGALERSSRHLDLSEALDLRARLRVQEEGPAD
jgi:hypothetical protein